MNKVLILASGLSARKVHEYAYKEKGWIIVTVNHGWMVTPDWHYNVIPDDYEGQLANPTDDQMIIWPTECKVIQNKFGGKHACGLSITLTASYWALGKLNPYVIGFLGADMNYTPNEHGHTHIYGVGLDIKVHKMPDPDRMVKTAQKLGLEKNYLEFIYKRFETKAEENNCKIYNFSDDPLTRLPYKQISVTDLF